jgi:hypothetical protein
MKKINEAGIKFRFKDQEEQPYGGSTWSKAKKPLITYYVAIGMLLSEEDEPLSHFSKGYERFNSYTQSFVKLLTIFPKDGGEKYNYIVKAMIGVADDRSEEDLKFAASNSVGKALEDCGIFSMYSEYPRPCKIRKAGDDDGGISKEVRPRGKEFNESKKRTIRLTESKLKKVISESLKKYILLEDKRTKQAMNRARQVIRERFNNEPWLDNVFNHQDNPKGLTYLEYILEQFLYEFDYNSQMRAGQIMRLMPLFCKLAFDFNFMNSNPDIEKLNQLRSILNHLFVLSQKGEDLSNIPLDATFEDLMRVSKMEHGH